MPAYQPPAAFVAEVSALLVQMGMRPLCTCGMAGTVPSTDGDCRSIGCDPSCPDPSCAEVLDLDHFDAWHRSIALV